jgi:hypothetical protein
MAPVTDELDSARDVAEVDKWLSESELDLEVFTGLGGDGA